MGLIRRRRRARDGEQVHRAWLTAPLLSFVWPGLGQGLLGRRRRALVHALVPLVVVLAIVVQLIDRPELFVLRLLVPSFALALILLIAGHAAWRAFSIADAWLIARPSGPARTDRSLPLVLVLIAAVLGSHLAAGVFIYDYNQAGQLIFRDEPKPVPGGEHGQQTAGDEPGGQADEQGDTLDELVDEDFPTTELGSRLDPGPGIPREGPLTVLLVGVDSAPGRDHALTDALMVGAFDRETNTVSTISIPRDTGRFPLYDGGVYEDRINSFLSHATSNRERYREGGIRALANQVAYLVGIPIHYYVVMDMAGFEQLVDLVGGVQVQLDYQIADYVHELYMEPGTHYLDGKTALTFVRSRFGPNNSDYRRAERQQLVLRALASRMTDPSVALRLPQIVREAANMARTNIPVDELEHFLTVLDAIDEAEATRIVLRPRRFAGRIPPAEVGGRFMTQLKMDAVAELSVELFGNYSLYDAVSPASPLPSPGPVGGD